MTLEVQNILIKAYPKEYRETVSDYCQRVSKLSGESFHYIRDLYYNRARLTGFARQHLIERAERFQNTFADPDQLIMWGRDGRVNLH